MYSELLKLIGTTVDAEDLLTAIDSVSNSLYQVTDIAQTPQVLKSIRADFAAVLARVPQADLKTYLEGLRQAVSGMRVLRLTVAVLPTQAGLEEISVWVKHEVGEDVVLDMTVDPQIIGGAIVNFAGRFVDLSLKPKFEERLKNYG